MFLSEYVLTIHKHVIGSGYSKNQRVIGKCSDLTDK